MSSTHEFKRDLCRALGLNPDRVYRVTLDMEAGNGPIVITAHSWLLGEEVSLDTLKTKYVVVAATVEEEKEGTEG